MRRFLVGSAIAAISSAAALFLVKKWFNRRFIAQQENDAKKFILNYCELHLSNNARGLDLLIEDCQLNNRFPNSIAAQLLINPHQCFKSKFPKAQTADEQTVLKFIKTAIGDDDDDNEDVENVNIDEASSNKEGKMNQSDLLNRLLSKNIKTDKAPKQQIDFTPLSNLTDQYLLAAALLFMINKLEPVTSNDRKHAMRDLLHFGLYDSKPYQQVVNEFADMIIKLDAHNFFTAFAWQSKISISKDVTYIGPTLEKFPDSIECHVIIASHSKKFRQDSTLQLAEFQLLHAKYPHSPRVIEAYLNALYNEKKYDDAIEIIKNAIEKNALSNLSIIDMVQQLVHLYIDTQQYEQGRDYFKSKIVSPKDYNYIKSAYLYMLFLLQDFDTMLSELKKCENDVNRNSTELSLFVLRVEDAVKAFKLLLEKAPKFAQLVNSNQVSHENIETSCKNELLSVFFESRRAANLCMYSFTRKKTSPAVKLSFDFFDFLGLHNLFYYYSDEEAEPIETALNNAYIQYLNLKHHNFRDAVKEATNCKTVEEVIQKIDDYCTKLSNNAKNSEKPNCAQQ